MVGKTYNSNRFTTLNAINASNVAGLHVVTAAPIGGTEPTVTDAQPPDTYAQTAAG